MSDPVKYHVGAFPPKSINWTDLIPLIGPANAAVARYDGLLNAIPNPGVLLSPLMTQEAVLSSRIEGTQATMGEVLKFEAEGDSEEVSDKKRGDIEEVLNYRKAMRHAEELMRELPLCQRVIKEAHAVLLDGVRGHGQAPGEYRRIPNWIGPAGCTIESARYIPIAANDLPDAMARWERHIHEDAPDRLVQLAILHAEFEALHPFLDGNGRLGRMLVPLFMAKQGLLSEPMFYISAFFERNRDEYYERLLAVSRDGDWTQWIGFFLRAVTEQARENQAKTQAIRDLYDETARRIAAISHSQYALHAAEFLFTRPIFRASDFYHAPSMTPASGRRILNLLLENAFFRVLCPASGRSPAILAYRELLNITEGRDVF
jgi:Fic family protein